MSRRKAESRPRRRKPTECQSLESMLRPSVESYAANLFVAIALGRVSTRLSGLSSADLTGDLVAPPPPEIDPDLRYLRVRLKAFAVKRGKTMTAVPGPCGQVGENLRMLGAHLGLSGAEKAILGFVVVHDLAATLREMTDTFGDLLLPNAAAIVAAAVPLDIGVAQAALAADGRLVSSGLLNLVSCDTSLQHKLNVPRPILEALLSRHESAPALLARVLPEAPPPSLHLDDFGHLHDGIRAALGVLAGALAQRRRGVNVLLHGPTGTGKSELARCLAAQLGVTLYSVGAADNDGDSPSSAERLASLKLGNHLHGGSRNALLLFDEFEDLFSLSNGPFARRDAQMSKLWFNRTLEANPVPTLWITNCAFRPS